MNKLTRTIIVSLVSGLPMLLIILMLTYQLKPKPVEYLFLNAGECYSNLKEEFGREDIILILQVGETKYREALWFEDQGKYLTKNGFTIYKDWLVASRYKKVACPKGNVYDIDAR